MTDTAAIPPTTPAAAVENVPPPAAPVAPTAQSETKEPAPTPKAGAEAEKLPVLAQPPVVQPTQGAPGMSATSGPLEDFPEGTK